MISNHVKFYTTVPEFVDAIISYQKMYNIKPVLVEKNRCVVASHPASLRLGGDVFALPFYILEPDAKKCGFDITTWN